MCVEVFKRITNDTRKCSHKKWAKKKLFSKRFCRLRDLSFIGAGPDITFKCDVKSFNFLHKTDEWRLKDMEKFRECLQVQPWVELRAWKKLFLSWILNWNLRNEMKVRRFEASLWDLLRNSIGYSAIECMASELELELWRAMILSVLLTRSSVVNGAGL